MKFGDADSQSVLVFLFYSSKGCWIES